MLSRLKHDLAVRHIPTAVVVEREDHRLALAEGAAVCLPADADAEALVETLDSLRRQARRDHHTVLVVDDDAGVRLSLSGLIDAIQGVDVLTSATWAEAEERLADSPIDCLVLDVGLPDLDGLEALERLVADWRGARLAVIVYTGRELSAAETARVRALAQSLVVKDAHSPERIVAELSLFLHLPEAQLPAEHRTMLAKLYTSDSILHGRRVLIIDDDVRNVFALTGALEEHGLEVVFAENGRRGIDRLREHPDVSLVLMDIMMPEMDGYETTRAIRDLPGWDRLPIIALTAKAMRDDRERCLAAGASDYITKPVDVDQLLHLMRVWLHR